MAYHVRGKLFCGLFQQVGKRDIVEPVDPAVGEFPASYIERQGRLHVLAVKIKMSQHPATISRGEETVADKSGQLLFDLGLGERAQIQIDIDHHISFVLYRAGGGDDVFHIADDRPVGQVFIVQKLCFQENAEIVLGGRPSVIGKTTAHFHIVRARISQNGVKNLMELMADVVTVHNVGGQGVGDDTRQIFQDKAESIVQRRFPFRIEKAVKRSVKTADIDAETGKSHVVSGIVEITYPVKSLFILRILLQRQDQVCGFVRGTQNGVGKLPEREIPGGDDGEIHADDHHGIGDHRSGKIQKPLDGTVHQSGLKEGLIPFLVFAEYFFQRFHKNNRIFSGNDTDIGSLRRDILIRKGGQDHHAVKWIP